MCFYNHLKGRGFEEGPTGPKINSVPVVKDLTTGQFEYQIEEKSRLERNFVVGVWIVEPGTQTSQTKTVAAAAVFNSAHIKIRRDQETVYEKLYLSNIKKANDQGRPYYLEIGTHINLSESLLVVNNAAAIVADTVIELVFDYAKKAR